MRSLAAVSAILLANLVVVEPFTAAAQLRQGRSRHTIGKRIPSSAELAKVGLDRQWWAQAGFDPRSDKLKSISVDEENVYVVSDRGNLSAFDAETGQRLWVYLIGDDNSPVLRPVSNSTQVLTAVGTYLVAVDKFTGVVQWRLRIPGQPSAAPTVDESNVYVGTLDGRVMAFNLRKIRQLFNDGKLPEYSFNARVWTYTAPSEITSPPATTDRSVNFASRSGIFTSVALSDRKLNFLFGTQGEILGPVARSADTAIIPSTDRNVYCIDSRNGQVKWTFASGLGVRRPMAIVDDSIYISPGALGLFQLDLEQGTRQWAQSSARQFVSATPTSVFATDSLNNLLVLDSSTGAIKSRLMLSGFEHQVPNTRTDRVFIATSTGLVVSLKERGREFPMYHRYPDRRPLLPEFADPNASEAESPEGDDEVDVSGS